MEQVLYEVGDLLCGYFKDRKKTKASASGGICSALSEIMITKMNGVVFGVVYSSDFSQVEYSVANTVDQLSKMRGSKYVTAKKIVLIDGKYIPVFDKAIDYLKRQTPVLFIGLGCDIAALYKKCLVEKIATDNLYTVDLICHGTTLEKVHTDYISMLEKRYKSRLSYFNVRYKKNGWLPPFIRAEFENGKVFEQCLYETDYGKAFAKIARNGCYNCCFKGKNHKADITAGDYWGITEEMPLYNEDGVSLFFINSTNGKKLVDALDNDSFCFTFADKEFALSHNPMYMNNRQKDPKYEQFCVDIKKVNLLYAVLHYEGFVRGIYWRIKDKTKK